MVYVMVLLPPFPGRVHIYTYTLYRLYSITLTNILPSLRVQRKVRKLSTVSPVTKSITSTGVCLSRITLKPARYHQSTLDISIFHSQFNSVAWVLSALLISSRGYLLM